MSNILFYSQKCKYSMLFIKKLQDENMIQEFRLIDILEIKKIPDIITNIPTIIVKNINVPLSGINAFNWLENSKYFYRQTNNINNIVPYISISQDSISNDNTNNRKTEDFANINDDDDDKITKNKFNSATENRQITDNINQQIKDNKLSQDQQLKQLNELLMVRKTQLKNIIEKNNHVTHIN